MFEDASFAIHAGNWLQSAKPATSQDSSNICEVALGVLHNTSDNQLILAMIHAVLRQVENQLQDDPSINPLLLAARVIKEIKAEFNGAAARAKIHALRNISSAMEDEDVTSAQRQFLQQVLALSAQRSRLPTGPKLSAAKP